MGFYPEFSVFFSDTDKIKYVETSTERLFTDNEFHETLHRESHTLFTDANGSYPSIVRSFSAVVKFTNWYVSKVNESEDQVYTSKNLPYSEIIYCNNYYCPTLFRSRLETFLFAFHTCIIPRWERNYHVVRNWKERW